MTESKRAIAGVTSKRHDARASEEETDITREDLVFRPDVRMLNGSGPLNEPMRVLYVDGSDASFRAYEACEAANLDFSVVMIEPGAGVVLHDRLLHADFAGSEEIERGIAFAKNLYVQMAPLVDEALSEPKHVQTRDEVGVVAKAVEAEREERHTRVQQAVARFGRASRDDR